MNNQKNETRAIQELIFTVCQCNLSHLVAISIGLFSNFLAIVANIIVIGILIRKKHQKTSFDLVITSLSLTDLSASVCTIIYSGYRFTIIFVDPKDIGKNKRQRAIVMNVISTFFFLSLLHVLLVTFLRFCAIFWPLKFRQYATKVVIRALIVATWILSAIAVIIIILAKDPTYVIGMTIHVSFGLVSFAYIMIAMKIFLLLKKKQFFWNKEHRVLLNSFGVTISFFACLFPFALVATSSGFAKLIDRELALSFISINFITDPLLYFYFSYWLSKRDEMRRIRSRSEANEGQNV